MYLKQGGVMVIKGALSLSLIRLHSPNRKKSWSPNSMLNHIVLLKFKTDAFAGDIEFDKLRIR